MLTKEENERLTQTGRGTPMGDVLRYYWHPVGVVSELEIEPVQPVRILGEDLTLFRSERGEIGLIGDRCAHRAISMAYGIPQENGLRCAYHGWTYDTEGRVVDMPFEPACLPLKITSYPVQTLAGLVWAYLGPQPAPLLPRWDVLVDEGWWRTVRITPLPCNWLQCMDNSLDPVHFEHLHGVYGNYVMKKLGRPPMLNPARHLKIEFDLFEYGIYKRRLVEGQPESGPDWQVGHPILFPNILAQGGPEMMSFQIRTPTDDTHTMHVTVDARPLQPGEPRQEAIPIERDTLAYDEQGRVFASHIVRQDEMAWVGQGPTTDRTAEHLVTSDRGIMLYRKLILENVERVQRGEEPIGVIRDPDLNEPMIRIKRGSTYTSFKDGVPEEEWGGTVQPWLAPAAVR
jgi:5,5'-dehydrodivanillate O-demethylase